MPIPLNIKCNPKLIAYQKLVTTVREYNINNNSNNKESEVPIKIACYVFKEIQELFPNKNFYEQIDIAIELFKNNPDKYTQKKDVIIITI